MDSKSTRLKRRSRLGSIERDMLEELSAGDLLYGFLLSARSTRRMYRLARERAAYRHRRKLAIERLIERKFVQESGERLALTRAGKHALGALAEDTRRLLEQSSWDGKWRIVTFDIPEKYAGLRRKVREVLKKAGFRQLQQSLWIFPHECKELAELIKSESKLSRYILYGVLERIEGDAKLINMFRL